MALQIKPEGSFFGAVPKRTLILCLFLVACTLAVYNPIGRNGFVNFDDDDYITNNRHVQSGLQWTTVTWAFTSFDAANWHPLTWLSHALDYELFKLNPAGSHYTNVLLHSVNVVLLFWLLAEATGRTGASLAAALAFALHPLNVESVAWAAERKNVLSMMFLLLALWAYQRYARKPSVRGYAVVALAYACGLMAKPQVITLPFLLLLWDYWPLSRLQFGANAAGEGTGKERVDSPGWLVVEKMPLLVLSAASAVITLHAQRAGGAMRSTMYPFSVRMENAVFAYLGYVRKFVWPVDLAVMYPHPGASLRAWQVAVAGLFLIAVSTMVVFLQKRPRPPRYLAVGWFWFLGALVPMIGLVQVGQQAMADRYMYVPMIGLLIMFSWGLADWAGAHRGRQLGLALAVALVLAAFGVLTCRQIGFWQSSETLWSHALAVTKNNYVAHLDLGETLVNHGRIQEAAIQFRAAAKIRPDDPAALLNLASCDRRSGNFAPALAEDQAVLGLISDPALRAYTLTNQGIDYRGLKDYVHARQSYTAALSLQPETARAFMGLGVIAQRTGDFAEAVKDYGRAADLEPSDVAYLLLSQALQQNGQPGAAQAALEQARQHSPDFDRAQQAVSELLTQ
ncbi:MAG: tetratricopeptide repeat protein [Candidatus Sulfotelmatobacter sp.]